MRDDRPCPQCGSAMWTAEATDERACSDAACRFKVELPCLFCCLTFFSGRAARKHAELCNPGDSDVTVTSRRDNGRLA